MKKMVTFYLDDKPVQARAGEKILWAALDAGVTIPHLCAMREREEPFGACRLCFVEVEGRELPVTACSEPVTERLRVRTTSERVNRLRRTAFELLMSHHDLDCRNCPANRRCALQDLAKVLKVSLRPKRLRKLPTEIPVDSSHPEIVLNPNRCVLCGKCVWVCQQVLKTGALDFVLRGIQTRVAPFQMEPLAQSHCTGCASCADVCPVGALTRKDAPPAGAQRPKNSTG
jgi:formate dehydrogenase major subunit/NADH-quinone oxidoreductase subunit G